MSDNEPHAIDWTAIIDEIEDDSPYYAFLKNGEVILYLPDSEEIPGGIVGTLHTPADWNIIKHDVQRFGVWPSRVSF